MAPEPDPVMGPGRGPFCVYTLCVRAPWIFTAFGWPTRISRRMARTEGKEPDESTPRAVTSTS